MIDDKFFKLFSAVEAALDDLRQEVRTLRAENVMLKRRPAPMCAEEPRNPLELPQRIERANPEAGEF